MTICPGCGANNAPSDLVCIACGADLRSAARPKALPEPIVIEVRAGMSYDLPPWERVGEDLYFHRVHKKLVRLVWTDRPTAVSPGDLEAVWKRRTGVLDLTE